MRRRYDRRREQAPDPNWRQPRDTSHCARSADGRHRWITTAMSSITGETVRLPYPTCAECLEIDERETAPAEEPH